MKFVRWACVSEYAFSNFFVKLIRNHFLIVNGITCCVAGYANIQLSHSVVFVCGIIAILDYPIDRLRNMRCMLLLLLLLLLLPRVTCALEHKHSSRITDDANAATLRHANTISLCKWMRLHYALFWVLT